MTTYEEIRTKFITSLHKDEPEWLTCRWTAYDHLIKAIAEVIDSRMGTPYRTDPPRVE